MGGSAPCKYLELTLFTMSKNRIFVISFALVHLTGIAQFVPVAPCPVTRHHQAWPIHLALAH